MALAVSSRRLTAEDQFPSPARLCEIYGWKFGTGTLFFSQVRLRITPWMLRTHILLNIPPVRKKVVKSWNLKSTALSEFGDDWTGKYFNPLNAELNPICYLLALLSHHFLHVSRIRVKSLTLRLLMSYIYIYIYIYIYGAPILDASRSHTMTQHSR